MSYLTHFNLEKEPFPFHADPLSAWEGPSWQLACEQLKKGIAGRDVLFLLTGDIGTGKTTLIRQVLKTGRQEQVVARITDPGFEMHSLFEILAQDLGFADRYDQTEPFSRVFMRFLDQAAGEGKQVIVVVDEAQRIPPRFLAELRSWPDIDTHHILTVILAGQPAVIDILDTQAGPSWQTDIHQTTDLACLDKTETRNYIETTMQAAGARKRIFLPRAVDRIHSYSQGIFRLINTVCDQSLALAAMDGAQTVDDAVVGRVIRRHTLPAASKPERTAPAESEPGSARPDKETHPRSGRRLATAAVLAAAAIILFFIQFRQPGPDKSDKAADPPQPQSTASQPGSLLHPVPTPVKQTASAAPVPEGIPEKTAALPSDASSIQPIQAGGGAPRKTEKIDMAATPAGQQKAPFPPDPAGSIQPQVQTSESFREKMGLGYHPPDTGKISALHVPDETTNPGNNLPPARLSGDSRTPGPDQAAPAEKQDGLKDLDGFVQEVFGLNRHTSGGLDSSKSVSPDLTGSTDPKEGRPEQNTLAHQSSPPGENRTPDPEPDAIIDWLLKKKQTE